MNVKKKKPFNPIFQSKDKRTEFPHSSGKVIS